MKKCPKMALNLPLILHSPMIHLMLQIQVPSSIRQLSKENNTQHCCEERHNFKHKDRAHSSVFSLSQPCSFAPSSLSHSLMFPLFHLASPARLPFKFKLVSRKIFAFQRDIFVCNCKIHGDSVRFALSVKCSLCKQQTAQADNRTCSLI